MSEVTTIGLDIAKNVFHAHGPDGGGRALFSWKIGRTSCWSSSLGSHDVWWRWRPAEVPTTGPRELTLLGHEVKLIPPAYVKPFVKRNKNDAVDAEAICEAAQRLNMRFVAVVGLGATPALDGRQAKAGIDHQDGRTNFAAPSHHRLQYCRSSGE